jgi:hypothetical protein
VKEEEQGDEQDTDCWKDDEEREELERVTDDDKGEERDKEGQGEVEKVAADKDWEDLLDE